MVLRLTFPYTVKLIDIIVTIEHLVAKTVVAISIDLLCHILPYGDIIHYQFFASVADIAEIAARCRYIAVYLAECVCHFANFQLTRESVAAPAICLKTTVFSFVFGKIYAFDCQKAF